jgi:hypothetical protein
VVVHLVDRCVGDLAPEFADASVCYDRVEFNDTLRVEFLDCSFGVGGDVAVNFDDDMIGVSGDWEFANLGDGGVLGITDRGDDCEGRLGEVFAEEFFANTCEMSA